MISNPLMLYVHIPYCVHKCHYCDFNSHVRGEPDWEGYQQVLLAELKQWSKQPQFAGRKLGSIFFGGGTPSLAPAELIASVIEAASKLFEFDADIEISLEANPGTVDHSRFAGFRKVGVNRLSIGVQSLDDVELKWLERIHSGEQAVTALKVGRAAGFENINLDLIYGLPDQFIEQWMNSLNRVIELGPEHLSCYQLTVEPHTKLAANFETVADQLPDDELALDFLYQTRERLAEAGYKAYEISNFARPGMKCRHNDGYWLYRDYIGIGAGASGKFDLDDGGVTRYSNIRNPEKYIESALKVGRAINSDEKLPKATAEAESLWQGLRRTGGISNAWFTERFGTDIQSRFGGELEPWLAGQKLIWDGDHLHLTNKGLPFVDSIAEELF
ncbi:MAG TPA: radical SAM family heme chaperone HemW [Mariprofundaceae bacterium]|nr:radical SAM family heme chaperone HemW [Mariprofundaceae bacterium]